MTLPITLLVCCLGLWQPVRTQRDPTLGKFQEVFAWKQLTYDFHGIQVTSDNFGDMIDEADVQRNRRELANNSDKIYNRVMRQASTDGSNVTFFIQYNNIPMGVERVGDRLFVTVPRRRYGIPSTLNYLDLSADRQLRSPHLRPYPNSEQRNDLTSVYRTRADNCGRLWMIDTGVIEIPNNPVIQHMPAIVIYDLNTNEQIRRYFLPSEFIPSPATAAGLASITIELPKRDCSNAYAYIPDLTNYGLIVYSFRENRSWRVTHNFFHFEPTASNLNIAGQRFQWNDGIFSISLSSPLRNGCRNAWFHPMVSTQEFTVNTCILRNSSATLDPNYWAHYFHLGNRGEDTQSTMHDFHPGTNVLFFAEIGRDAISCWNARNPLTSINIGILAQNNRKLSYPSDLHVTGDEVWVMANALPRWAYSRLNTDDYNFFIYKGNVRDLVSNTVCAPVPSRNSDDE